MVRDEDHGALLDRHRDPLRDRLRALLPRLHVLPALSSGLDHWANWLVRERFAHLSDDERAEMLARLERTRDRVLDGATLRAGETFADVGAGTGLLAIGAAERVGEDGDVIAIDVSADALEELRRVCTSPNVAYLIGSADVLPLVDGGVDVVATRSVLIYVHDKAEAAREFFRVLRPSGRVSIHEPINRAATKLWDVVDFGDFRDRVVADFEEEWPPTMPMLDFDEEDLVQLFTAAGFADVEVERDAVVEAMAGEQLLVAVGAPGHRSLADRWRDAFAPDELAELERRMAAAGTITLTIPTVLLTGVKP